MNRPSSAYPLTLACAVAVACGLLLGAGGVNGALPKDALRIENVTVTPRDPRTAVVRFDIAWDSSWRDKTNHDAAWVFFKVRADGKADWQHIRLAADKVLNPTGCGHEKGPTALEFIVPDGDDGFTGMFVRRAAKGKGALSARGITAVWDFTANKGITKDTKVSMRAFGIEMVYVAEGPFYLGSGGAEVNGFYMYTDGSQHTQPYRVTSAGAIPTGRGNGRLWARKGAQPEDGGEIPAAFPNGYTAFYCMKRHITWNQYAGFLNTLTAAQAAARCPEERRRVIRSGEPPNCTYSAARRGAAKGLSWADCAAWAAWAALRPMTELEWEKAIRGPREPVPDEVGPSYWNIPFGHWFWVPLHDRDGERPVTVGNVKGRRFRGTHGRGTATLPADWPQDDAVGAGMRCSWYTPSYPRDAKPYPRGVTFIGLDLPRTRTSDRLHAARVDPHRHPHHKWRGVRTAPREATK